MEKSSGKLKGLKQLVPANLKSAVKKAILDRKFRSAIRQVSSLPQGQTPSREVLMELQVGWGNEGFAARTDYLEEVARRAATTRGPILECGSGLTSILLGLLAGRRGVETWSLEHIPEWRARVEGALRRYDVPGVHIQLSKLRDYEGFAWYDPPLASMPQQFQLVICDGPPGATAGGRYGLLPVLGERLSTQSVILLDDSDREGEAEVLQRWMTEDKWKASQQKTETGAYAVLTRE
jgi:hypothetical protein